MRLAELKDEPLVSAPNDTYLRRLVDAAAMSAGFGLHYSVTVDRLLSILHHVFAGVGIGILPSGCIPEIQWGEGCHSALLVEPSLSVTVGLISSRSRYMTPAAAGMATLIREQMAVKAPKSS